MSDDQESLPAPDLPPPLPDETGQPVREPQGEQVVENIDEGMADLAGLQQETKRPPRPPSAVTEIKAGAQVFIIGKRGKGEGIRFELKRGEKVGIGRDSALCRILLLGGLVSRLHCTISFDGTQVLVEDAGSQNGTFINEEQIDAAVLPLGAELRVGSTIFVLEAHNP